MGLLDTLMNDAEARATHENFADRVTQEAPGEGYSGDEALQHHQQIAGQLSNGEYQHAALAAFQQMTPEQRKQFRQTIDQRMGQPKAHKAPAGKAGGHEPDELASLVSGLHSQSPGMLGSLLGGGSGGGVSSVGKMALGGIAAMAVKQALQHH